MSLPDPRISFGIHSITPYDRSTGEPFGILKVLGDAEVSFAAGDIDLFGGSNKFPWANETLNIESSLSASVKSLPDFLFEKFLGASVTTIAASSTGTISTIANKNGTSVVDATTGIASITLATLAEDDLKIGRLVVKAVSATTIDVFQDTDLQFTRGTNAEYQDALLKVNASPITVPGTAGTIDITELGLTITGGTGTVAFTTDDTAELDVAPPHDGISDIKIGESTIRFPEFGAIMHAQERSSGDLFRIEAFKVKASSGMTLPMAEGGYMIPNLAAKLLYDSAKDGVAIARAVKGT